MSVGYERQVQVLVLEEGKPCRTSQLLFGAPLVLYRQLAARTRTLARKRPIPERVVYYIWPLCAATLWVCPERNQKGLRRALTKGAMHTRV